MALISPSSCRYIKVWKFLIVACTLFFSKFCCTFSTKYCDSMSPFHIRFVFDPSRVAGISDPHVTWIIYRIDSKDGYVITRAAKCGYIICLFFGRNKIEVTVFLDDNSFYDISWFQLTKKVVKIIFIFFAIIVSLTFSFGILAVYLSLITRLRGLRFWF